MTPDRRAGAAAPDAVRALALLAIATLLAMSPWFSGTAIVGTLSERWGLRDGGAALLTIAVQLGFVLGSLAAATFNLLDVFAPRGVFVAACAGAAAANLGVAWAPDAASGLALRFATGLFLAGTYPTALKLLSTWFVRGRGLALGVMVGAVSLGSALPHLVRATGGADARAVLVATSALTLLAAAIGALGVHEGPFPFPRARFDPRQAGRVLRDRGVRLACVGYFGHMWELYAMWGWFLLFAGDAFAAWAGGATPATARAASLATFAVIGSGLFGCALAGATGDRYGRTLTCIVAMAVSGACALGIGLLHGGPAWALLAVGVVWGVTVVADSAQFSTMVTELADPAYVGTALTLQLGIGFLLTVATLWLLPLARDAFGWTWAFAVLAPGPLVGIWAMVRLRALPDARRLAGGRG